MAAKSINNTKKSLIINKKSKLSGTKLRLIYFEKMKEKNFYWRRNKNVMKWRLLKLKKELFKYTCRIRWKMSTDFKVFT